MENLELVCPICGEPTFVYMGNARKDRLCKKHGMMKKNGEIEEKEGGIFVEVSTGKILNPPPAKEVKKEEKFTQELTCLICGEPSNGKHFCLSCYHNYKDKSIDLRITNCKEIKILDQYGNLSIECDDGRRVRSRAEALISNFFYNNRIRSVYEKTVYYTDPQTGEDKTLHPDFYLPDYDLYIEYNEIKKKSYLKSKEYTKKIYEMLGFKVLIMDDQDLNSIASCLKPKLKLN
ncbi:MAG: hypothetical protein II368_05505 [Clostridia bacterium]|nr:hypothetical protein [Clostridia bacterium]MBQ5801670.1 hypothetical protein [Clostridia bacterium]